MGNAGFISSTVVFIITKLRGIINNIVVMLVLGAQAVTRQDSEWRTTIGEFVEGLLSQDKHALGPCLGFWAPFRN